jgi:4-carboxymuconolactone decarboxylase
MKIMKTDRVPKELITDPDFKPGKAYRQVFSDVNNAQLDVFTVHFSEGCRNPWHTHSSDQVILVTAGKGIIASADKENLVEVGDLIVVPAGEKHWQGATKNSEFSHFYVLAHNCKTTVHREDAA